ncbi:MAG: hypothetical protein FWH35_05520 [Treponema sp.]|nr:hypothetical protein [Treponema sp.]
MSESENPYRSPEAEVISVKPLAAEGTLTENMLIYLKSASPWLRFCGIMYFVGAGGMAAIGIIMMILIPLMESSWVEIPGLNQFSIFSGVISGGLLGLVYLVPGVIMFFPGLFIYRFGDKIRSYIRTGTEADLESAFKNNKSLWKFNGILYIISLSFIPLIIIGGIIAAIVISIA